MHGERAIEGVAPEGEPFGVTAREYETGDARRGSKALSGKHRHVGREVNATQQSPALEGGHCRWDGGAAPKPNFENTVAEPYVQRRGSEAIATPIEEVEDVHHRPCRRPAGMSEQVSDGFADSANRTSDHSVSLSCLGGVDGTLRVPSPP